MTTFPLNSAERMHADTRQQAKRLRERLGISLAAARDILAQEVYRCKHWRDLKARIDTGAHHETRIVLASPSNADFQNVLQCNEVGIARAIGGRVLANVNLAGMLEIVRYVFTEREQATTVRDVAAPLHASPWLPAGIGPDAYAVIEAYANINGQPIKLIGTRVYMPEYLNLPPHLRENAQLAARHGEHVAIMWSDPKGWFDTACAFLDDLSDDLDEWPAFVEPRLPLDSAMKRHAKWFGSLTRYWSTETRYGSEDEMFHPLVTALGPYLIFGIPVAHDRSDPPVATKVDCGAGGNTSTLAHLHGHPVRIESLTLDPDTGNHEDDFTEHAAAVSAALFRHPSYCPPGGRRVYFVTPIVDFDLRHAFSLDLNNAPGQETFAIKTDRIDVLDDLLKALRRRDIVWFDCPSGTRRYVATLQVPGNDFDGFSVNLELRGDEVWHSSGMIEGVVWQRQDDHCIAHLELRPSLLTLVDMLGSKTIMDAVRDGLVLRRPAGFRDALSRSNIRHAGLAEASVALRKAFEHQKFPPETSIVDLLANVRYTRFRRDHF